MKTSRDFQEKYRGNQFYNDKILMGISPTVKLHDEVHNPLSSAAACLNVLGYLNQNRAEIVPFFREFDLPLDEVVDFPSGADIEGEIYADAGPIVFEWIGPRDSPINERGGSRGQNRTSVDGFFIAKMQGRYTQVFVEWKFTESYTAGESLHRFGGLRGIERLRRYSSVLSAERKGRFPFQFSEEDTLGLQDFSYEPLYQLLRMTLLAKETTPIQIGNIQVENYCVVHIVHSENTALLTVKPEQLRYSPGLRERTETDLHKLWKSLLSGEERGHFYCGYWDKALARLGEKAGYLKERYA